MMRLSFGNMTLKLNIFNLQRQPSGFDDMEFSSLHWVEDSILDDACDDVFDVEYESFLVNDEPEYDAFEFDDLYSTGDCLLIAASESASELVSPLLLN